MSELIGKTITFLKTYEYEIDNWMTFMCILL